MCIQDFGEETRRNELYIDICVCVCVRVCVCV